MRATRWKKEKGVEPNGLEALQRHLDIIALSVKVERPSKFDLDPHQDFSLRVKESNILAHLQVLLAESPVPVHKKDVFARLRARFSSGDLFYSISAYMNVLYPKDVSDRPYLPPHLRPRRPPGNVHAEPTEEAAAPPKLRAAAAEFRPSFLVPGVMSHPPREQLVSTQETPSEGMLTPNNLSQSILYFGADFRAFPPSTPPIVVIAAPVAALPSAAPASTIEPDKCILTTRQLWNRLVFCMSDVKQSYHTLCAINFFGSKKAKKAARLALHTSLVNAQLLWGNNNGEASLYGDLSGTLWYAVVASVAVTGGGTPPGGGGYTGNADLQACVRRLLEVWGELFDRGSIQNILSSVFSGSEE